MILGINYMQIQQFFSKFKALESYLVPCKIVTEVAKPQKKHQNPISNTKIFFKRYLDILP